MKKLVLAALVGVAFTGCVQNEEFAPKPQKEISFEVANKVHSTRANGAFDYTSFAASAWVTDDATKALFEDKEVTKQGDVWKTTDTYYWPLEGTVDFICYYPTTVIPDIDYKYAGADELTYTDYTVADVDVMYADKAIRYSANKSATDNGADFGITGYGFTGVPTLFHHALAKLNFEVQNGNPTDGIYKYVVTVHSITANNIHKTGSVTLKQEGTPTTASHKAWKLPTNAVWTTSASDVPATYTWGTADVVLDTDEVKPFNEKIVYVMPQELDGTQTVTVNYTVDQYSDSGSTLISSKNYNPTHKLFIDLSKTPLQYWQMNKNITYTLKFNPKGEMILFAPAVEDWVDVPGSIVIM